MIDKNIESVLFTDSNYQEPNPYESNSCGGCGWCSECESTWNHQEEINNYGED